MTVQEITSTKNPSVKENMQKFPMTYEKDQYKLWQILGIWLAGGVPMWLLGWVAFPALSVGMPPLEAGMLRLKLLTAGLIWQFVLAMIILYREEGNIRLSTIGRRFWLNHPVSVRTGETRKALWWWIVPLFLLVAFMELAIRPLVVNLWTTIFPFFTEPESFNSAILFSPDFRAQLVGACSLLGLFTVSALFNTVLGEEFLFRGVLLPKMEGIFGKWDWVANGVLFGFYHLHQPWGILSNVLFGLIVAFSGKRFRSNWFPIILHSGQSIYFLFLISGLVLGLA